MNFEAIAWGTFRKTGDIEAYLLHKNIENAEKEKWNVLKHGELSQNAQNTGKPIVF